MDADADADARSGTNAEERSGQRGRFRGDANCGLAGDARAEFESVKQGREGSRPAARQSSLDRCAECRVGRRVNGCADTCVPRYGKAVRVLSEFFGVVEAGD